MMLDPAVLEFAIGFRQEVLLKTTDPTQDGFSEDEFTRAVVEYLVDAGEVDDGEACSFSRKSLRVSGYSVAADEERVDLFLSVHTDSIPPRKITKNALERGFRQLRAFLDSALDGDTFDGTRVSDVALKIQELAAQT